MLDTLFMDGLYTDLERLSRTNRILEQLGRPQAVRAPGGVAAAAHARHRAAARYALGRRASTCASCRAACACCCAAWAPSSSSGMQLVSYLLFESGFTRALIDMGYRDAMAMEDELRAFLFDEPMATLYAPAHLKLALDR